MSVVGHVEQLRLSKCYQQSEMDCTTCHHLHAEPLDEDPVALYRSRCLECHNEDGCGLDLGERQRQSEADNCMQCHMPRGPTDIPHFAFTHHRIGIHQENDEEPTELAVGQLVPMDNIDHLPPADQQRCLALAYLTLADSEKGQRHAEIYNKRGLDSLYDLHERGLRDPEVEAALAWGFWRLDPRRCIEHAQTALRGEPLTPMTRRDALSVLARTYVDTGQYQQAVATLEQLARLQRDAVDSALLARCLSRLGKVNEAIEAAQLAASIEPNRPDLQEFLAMLHDGRGEKEQAAAHWERAEKLKDLPAQVLGRSSTE